jgi:hypothetical protein
MRSSKNLAGDNGENLRPNDASIFFHRIAWNTSPDALAAYGKKADAARNGSQ